MLRRVEIRGEGVQRVGVVGVVTDLVENGMVKTGSRRFNHDRPHSSLSDLAPAEFEALHAPRLSAKPTQQ